MSINPALYEYCLYNKREEIGFLIHAGCDVNVINEDGQTPLFAACMSGAPETVTLLLDHGASVNHQDHSGQTSLHTALDFDHIKIAKILISNFGANMRLRNDRNKTALHVGVDKGHFEIAHILRDKLLEEDIGTENSWLQLHAACYAGDEYTVTRLLEIGTNVNAVSTVGYTALVIACENRRMNIIDILLQNDADPNKICKRNRTALQIAVVKSDSDVVSYLLQHKANPNVTDADGDSPLHLAIHKRRDGILSILLDYQADVNIVNNKLETPLHVACEKNDAKIVHQLLKAKNKAQVNVKCADNSTPLQIAVVRDNSEIIRLLCEYGANTSLKGKHNYTPLHVAAGQASFDTMVTLLSMKPALNIRDEDGDTPLHIAVGKGHADKVLLLCQNGADKNSENKVGMTPFELAVRADKFNVITQFLEHGYDVNSTLKSCETLLYYCCRKRQSNVVDLLLNKGVDVDLLCSRGSALDAALDNCDVHVVTKLVQAGANVTIVSRPRNNSTALDRIYQERQIYKEVLQYLIDNKPEVVLQKTGYLEETLLQRACRDNATDVVDLLINCQNDIGINECNRHGQSPVYVVCENKNVHFLSVLLNNFQDIDVDKADDKRTTPLHVACRNSDVLIVNMLLRRSMKSLESKDKFDCQPLHFVRDPDILQLLINWNADLSCRNYVGQTPLLLFCLEGEQEMVKAITDKLDIDDLNASDRMGRNIVHLCVFKENHKILKNALAAAHTYSGMDFVNAKDINEQTGLHIAALNDDLTSTQHLIEAGADLNIQDKSGLTPLLLSRSTVYKELKERGADLSCVSIRGCDYDTMHAWREQMTYHSELQLFEEIVRGGENYMEQIINMQLIGFIDRHPNQYQEFLCIKGQLRKFMERLSKIVGKIDELMEFELMPSGSMNEETKVGIPDEGDFVCILPKVSAMLVPPEKFIFHTTYVTLSTKDDVETLEFVDSTQRVFTHVLFRRFYEAVARALADPELWKEFPQLYRAQADDINGHLDKISNLTLMWHGLVYKWIEISVDIVPALYFEGWKPSWCEDREVLENSKCCIVAKDIKHAPEKIRPYLFQLCFTECDAAMFRLMMPELKEGYMLAKLVRQPHICHIMIENDVIPLDPVSKYISSYMLKTATYHVYEEMQSNYDMIKLTNMASQTMAAVACARLIYEKLRQAFEANYLEMFFVPAFDIFRNHFESRHDQYIAKKYCDQLANILSQNPRPNVYGVHYTCNDEFYH